MKENGTAGFFLHYVEISFVFKQERKAFQVGDILTVFVLLESCRKIANIL